MKIYEFKVRVSSAYEEIGEAFMDDILAKKIHEAIVSYCRNKLGAACVTDFSVELSTESNIKKIYDSDAKLESIKRKGQTK